MRRSLSPELAARAAAATPDTITGGDRLVTEFEFELPRGYVDGSGTVHRHGVMRLATARDELVPLIDGRVQENSAYLTVVLLARVIVSLGSITEVHPGMVEQMFASDLAFLQDLYRRINQEGHTRAAVTCPACNNDFTVDMAGGRLGGS
jgi:hypothetical protein